MPEVIAKQEEELTQQALTIVERAQLVRIVDQPTYDLATTLLLTEIKPLRKRWTDYWDEVKRPLRKAVDAVQAKFNAGDGPLENAERQIKGEINRWDAEQQRIQQERQRAAQELADREAEEERNRAAIVAEEAGATAEEVQAIAEAPTLAIAPPVPMTYQKASGVSKRDNWKGRVVDIKKLCLAIAKGQVPANYVLPNEAAINARAKADKNTLNVPGVVAYNEPIISGRPR
jgi:hypothetical protein